MARTSTLTCGDYRLDRVNNELWREHHQIALTPKTFAVLRYLMEHAGHVVSKEALLDAIWPDIHVGEAVLKVSIQRLRTALRDSADSPHLIETVRGRGYHFLPDVTEQPTALPLPDMPSIAILPFVAMSAEPEAEHFCDGMTEVLITDLAKLSGLFVIARNSVFTYKGQAIDVVTVGHDLGVRYVLEGSIQKVQGQVRIAVQLIDTTTGGHIWAERYDRPVADLFALQDEITQQIVRALTVTLTLDEQDRRLRRDTNSLEAYENYWRAETLFWQATEQENYQARACYQRAIDLDPGYARAYAGLAQAWSIAEEVGWTQDPHSVAEVEALAQHALSLDATIATANHVLAWVWWTRGQHDKALAHLEHAVVLAPNDAYGYLCLGEILGHADRPEEGIKRIEHALRLNPHAPPYYLYFLGQAYYFAERYEDAIDIQQQVLARTAHAYWPALLNLAVVYSALGRPADARAAVTETVRLNPTYSLAVMQHRKPLYHDHKVFQREMAALRKAGLQ